MQIAIFDIVIKHGETYCQDAVFRDKKTKEPLDLTGITAKAQVRPSEGSATLIADLICDVYPEEGRVQLSLPDTVTAAIDPGFYTWDLKMTDTASGMIAYDIEGKFIVKGSTTK